MMDSIFNNLLVSSPNEGGIFFISGNKYYKLDDYNTTGLYIENKRLLRGYQPDFLGIYDEQYKEIQSSAVLFDDIHDVLFYKNSIYIAATMGNEIIKLDLKGNEVKRWKFNDEKDSFHINCLAVWNDRIIFSAFGEFTEHRGYKNKTRTTGFVQDLLSGRKLIIGLSQPHSLLPVGKNLFLANSELKEVVEFSSECKVIRNYVLNGYTRGLYCSGNILYVGLSKSRNIKDQDVNRANIVAIDLNVWREIGRIELDTNEIYSIEGLSDTSDALRILAQLGSTSFGKIRSTLKLKQDEWDAFVKTSQVEAQARTQALQDLDAELKELQDWAKAQTNEILLRDDQIKSLNMKVADASTWGHTLENTVVERDTLINELNEKLKELTDWGRSLEDEVIKRDLLVGELNDKVKDSSMWAESIKADLQVRDNEILRLNSVISTVSSWASSLEKDISDRDARIHDLISHIDELSSWASSLEKDIKERDARIHHLSSDLEEFSSWAASLEKDVSERDARIQNLSGNVEELSSWALSLEKDVSDRDARIHDLSSDLEQFSSWALSLEKDVSDRDARIHDLSSHLEEFSSWASSLEKGVSDRDARIHDLNRQVDELSSWAASLQKDVSERDVRIHSLNHSVEEVSFWAESLKNDLVHKNDEISLLNDKIVDILHWTELLQTKANDKDEVIRALNIKVDDISVRAQNLEVDLINKERVLNESAEKMLLLAAENESNVARLVEKDDLIIELNQKNYELSQFALGLENTLNSKQSSIDQLKEELKKNTEENYYLIDQLKDAQALAQSIQDQLVNAEIKNINLQNEINSSNESFSLLKHDFDKLKYEYDAIHSELLRISDWASAIDRHPIRYALKKYMLRLAKGVYRRLPMSIAAKQQLRALFRRQSFSSASVENDINLILENPISEANPNAEIRDVFVFAVIDWHFRIQRPQHIAKGLAKAGSRVFYFSNHFVDDATPGYQIEKLADVELYQVKLNILGAPAIYFDAPTEQAQTMLEQSMAIFIADFSCISSISILQHAYWYDLVKKLPNTIKTYDCMDHHEGFGNVPEKLIAIEKSMLSETDFVIVTSTWLENFAADYNKNIITVRNACEYSHFCDRPESIYADSAGRKIIGYYGAIAEWFDIEIIKHLARKHPEYLILLVGADTVGAQKQLSDFENIVFTGEVPYSSLPYYLYAFDVGLLPFQVIPLTLATNPVKVYEYLSAGKPVVCVDLPEIIQFGDLVFKASNIEEFTTQVEIALEAKHNGGSAVLARKEFAAQQTWDHRAADIVKAIQNISLPKVSVIVLTYNNLELTKACLDSLYKYSLYPNLEVIVVDNASTDETPQFLQEFRNSHPDALVILNKENLGFSAGNNVGLAAATGDYLVLLNNDTYVTPGWVLTMLNHLRCDNSIGIIGPVTNNIGNEAKIDINYSDMEEMHKYAKGYTLSHMGQHIFIGTTAFFCVMIPKRVYEQVGPMDEKFGRGFFEDDDYCRRIEKINLKVACADDVFIHHHLSASFNKLGADVKQKLFEDNKAYYEAKWGAWVPHKYRNM